MSDACLSNKQRISIQNLKDYAAGWPDVNLSGIMGGSEDQFRCPIASSADIRDIRLFRDKYFSGTKITYDTSVSF